MFEADGRLDYELLKDVDWLREIDEHISKEAFAPAKQLAETKSKDANASTQAAALYAKAKLAYVRGEQIEATEAAEEALAKFRTLGVGMGEAIALHTLAQIKLDAKSFETNQSDSITEAMKHATEALTQFQKAHSGKGEAAVLNTLAKIYYLKRDPVEALKQADLAQQTFKGMDDLVGEATAVTTKATIFLMTENFDLAFSKAHEARTLCKTVKTPSARVQEANALLISSAAAIPNSKFDDAMKAAKEAKALFTDLGGECGIAKSFRALAFCNLMLVDIEEAVNCIEAALPLAQKHANKVLLASILSVGALVYRNKLIGDKANADGRQAATNEQKALQMAKDALACYQDIGDERAIALVRIDLAQTYIECGNTTEAFSEAKKSQETFERLGEKVGEGIASLTLSELQFNMGSTGEAIDTARKAQYLLNDFEGTKEADKLLGVMQPGIDGQHRGITTKWSTALSSMYKEGPLGSGMSKTTYSHLLSMTMRAPGHDGEFVLDSESIKEMGNFTGVNFPFLRTWTKQLDGSKALPAPTPTQIPIQAPTPAPAPAPVRKSGPLMLERQVLDASREIEHIPITGSLPEKLSIVGSDDILGGRVWGCPETLHNQMVALALRGELAIIKPQQRDKNISAKRKITFTGSHPWRDAVKFGYIHPDFNPPAGTRWRKVAFGWKLIEETPVPAEQSVPCTPSRMVHSSEPFGSMTLHAILQTACPNLKDNDIINVRMKLKKIQIGNTMTLLENLRNGKPEDLNTKLTAIEEKGLKEETLQALGEFCGSMH